MDQIKSGDFVCVRHPDSNKLSYGKVNQVTDRIVHYTVYAKPEDLPGGKRLAYHSKFELIQTTQVSKEFLENVVRSIKILRL
jgi:hypothetical protein